MLPTNLVDDDEHLYRNIRARYGGAGNPPRVDPEGFFDDEKKPSVDRAAICGFNPVHTRRDTDGVALLIAGEIRGIDDINLEAPLRRFAVDVIPDELPTNPAHAKIVLDPWMDHKKLFRRLRHSLARLAERRPWAIPPEYDIA